MEITGHDQESNLLTTSVVIGTDCIYISRCNSSYNTYMYHVQDGPKNIRFGLVYGVERHFQQYFSYIVAVSFIGGRNEYSWKTTDMFQVTDKLYHKYDFFG